MKDFESGLNDFVTNSSYQRSSVQTSNPLGTSTAHPLLNFVSFENISQSHCRLLSAITPYDEPKTYKHIVQFDCWKEAMEIQALEENGTWELITLPSGKCPIASKWVCRIKFKHNGNIENVPLLPNGYIELNSNTMVTLNDIRSD